jgi:hypothetical protein
MRIKNIILLGLLTLISMGTYQIISLNYFSIGFPLDDAWIHQTYAKNLAEFGTWSYFLGESTVGSTSPLWSIILSLGYFLHVDPFLWTFLMEWIILWGVSVVGCYTFTNLEISKSWWIIMAGIFLAFEWHLVWAAGSGMETLFFSLVVTATLLLILVISKKSDRISVRNWLGLGLIVGISTWIRPEAITLFGPISVVIICNEKICKKFRAWIIVIVGFFLLFSPYLLFNKILSGTWWPNTFYAKQAEYAVMLQSPLVDRLIDQYSLPLVGAGVILLPGFFYTIITAMRKRKWGIISVSAWVIGYLSIFALRLPVTYQHGRYVIPCMPAYFLLGLAGMVMWIQPQSDHKIRRIISQVWVISTGVCLILFWVQGALAYSRDVAIIESEMVVTAKWIKENTSKDDVIAAHDIGALGYFSGRELLDLAGLVSPEVIRFIRDEKRLELYLDENAADYLVTFPSWYPILIQRGEVVFESNSNLSLSMGGENMIVYIWKP